MQITAVCDVGSIKGLDALAFSAAAPRSSVWAFEPNPVNFGLMAAERAMREAQHSHRAAGGDRLRRRSRILGAA